MEISGAGEVSRAPTAPPARAAPWRPSWSLRAAGAGARAPTPAPEPLRRAIVIAIPIPRAIASAIASAIDRLACSAERMPGDDLRQPIKHAAGAISRDRGIR